MWKDIALADVPSVQEESERTVNQIVLAGKIVGRDAEHKSVGADGLVKFSVADNKKIKGEWVTTFFEVTVWGKRGETLLPMLKKGTSVTVIGELQVPVVKGEKCYLSIRCNEVHVVRESLAVEEHIPF